GGRGSRREFLRGAGAVGAAGLTALAGCTSGDGGGDGGQTTTLTRNISISGSSTVYPISTAIKELFFEDHPGVSISVSRDGTSAGFANAFIPGDSDINDASRPISQSERQDCLDNGFTPIEFLVARDALTVVVNNQNDWVDDITLDQLKEIWSPETPPQTWADVNSSWPDEEIRLFGAATTSGTFDYFTETVVGEEDKIRSDFQGTEQDDTIAAGVSGNKYAMGYLPYAYYSSNPDSVKALSINGVEPSLQTAKSGEYPLARPLFIYVNKQHLNAEPALQEFVRFYINKTDDESLIGEDIGYVPVSSQTVAENLQKLEDNIQ
ncbi:MAG: PstS family phosphate ABC transporter substrate-binding protein, partial [Halobacteriaceae archaeon]